MGLKTSSATSLCHILPTLPKHSHLLSQKKHLTSQVPRSFQPQVRTPLLDEYLRCKGLGQRGLGGWTPAYTICLTSSGGASWAPRPLMTLMFLSSVCSGVLHVGLWSPALSVRKRYIVSSSPHLSADGGESFDWGCDAVR